MSIAARRLSLYRSTYVAALHEYLRAPSEDSLTVAYELGRAAVNQQLSVLDVAVAYQQGLNDALASATEHATWLAVTRHAGDFLMESLASFEMLHRGIAEARSSISEHRHRTQLSRQLSTFLTDSSLALRASESLDEMLQLAVDQGREILGAGCCLVTLTSRGEPRATQAISHRPPDSDWAFASWLDLAAIYRGLQTGDGLLRLAWQAGDRSVPSVAPTSDRADCRWLAVSLTALDGTQIGGLPAIGPAASGFPSGDEAALTHLAQRVSATVERMRLYQQTTSEP